MVSSLLTLSKFVFSFWNNVKTIQILTLYLTLGQIIGILGLPLLTHFMQMLQFISMLFPAFSHTMMELFAKIITD